MADAQNGARALMEVGALDAFVTTFAYRRDGLLAKILATFPYNASKRLAGQLARRAIDEVDADLIHTYPMWEFIRTAAIRFVRGPIAADMAWDQLSHNFDRLVARRYVPATQAISAYEYTALSTFRKAKKKGVACILNLPSLDSLQFEQIRQREKKMWPELGSRYDAYFDAKFSRRYARRCEEIALADVIITNSSLTARSHIEAGADPGKVHAVPLAAPRPIEFVREVSNAGERPLIVLWAGSFSIRKGAHYLLQAWKRLKPRSAARLEVYGQVAVPARALTDLAEGVTFHGSVAQSKLFQAYEMADVLAFPTLSDGFGLVVAEAMAHGLPVIVSDQSGAADIVTRDNGIVVPAGDADALSDALRWCLDNRAHLANLRLGALETARRRQWSNYRKELTLALENGLRRAGYEPKFRLNT